MKNILIACEESQRVCTAFRQRGYDAYSCDLVDCSGGHPEWHIKGDVITILNPSDQGNNADFIVFETMDKLIHVVDKWDLIIAHPPCTYICVTGNRWFNEIKYGDKACYRKKLREKAVQFFMTFVKADCDKIAIENPVGYMNTYYRKPDQIIQPYYFGDPFEKKTCLWLKGLPNLVPTNIVSPEKRVVFSSGKTMPAWYCEAAKLPVNERSKVRSTTFKGMASAMAAQWGCLL